MTQLTNFPIQEIQLTIPRNCNNYQNNQYGLYQKYECKRRMTHNPQLEPNQLAIHVSIASFPTLGETNTKLITIMYASNEKDINKDQIRALKFHLEANDIGIKSIEQFAKRTELRNSRSQPVNIVRYYLHSSESLPVVFCC